MSINRFSKRRDFNEPEIIARFKELGCTVYRIDLPCDLLVFKDGTVKLAEVKQPNGSLNAKQKAFWGQFEEYGEVVRTIKEVDAMVNKHFTTDNAEIIAAMEDTVDGQNIP